MQLRENGIIIINKPAEISSAKVVSKIKRLTGASKVGHTGTLDPFATGVLICCMNKATRLARFFLNGPKTYEAVLRLGIETDTQDATGSVVYRRDVSDIKPSVIASTFQRFLGTINQKPPIYSALKHKGTSLYILARQGKPVQKPARSITIYDISIQELALPEIRFQVSCSSGTYIRALCADIGSMLGCGGHLAQLKRVENCGFHLKEAMSLSQIETACHSGTISNVLISMTDALRHMPTCTVNQQLKNKIRHGIDLAGKKILPEPPKDFNGYLKIVDDNHELIAVLSQKSVGKPFKYCCVF